MNTIDSIFSIVIIGITFGVMFCLVKQKKLKVLQAFWLALGCWLMIAAIVWLATVLQLYGLKESKNVWDIASMVFTFLGTALTVGTAIAGITALLSYISINDKLKKAEQDLNSAQEKLTEFKESSIFMNEKLKQAEQDLNSAKQALEDFNKSLQKLEKKKNKLEELLNKMELYKINQIQIQNLDHAKITNTETNQSIESAAEQILKSDYSQFEHRLKARAILDEIKLRKQFDEIRQNPSAGAWQQHIIASGEIMALWQLVYQTSNTSNREINRENYAITVSNYGTAYYFAALFHQHNEDKTIYFDLLHQASKQFDLALQINPNLYQAANNWGNILDREAQILPNTKLVEKRRLWQLAGDKYALILQIKPDDNLAAINWGIVLGNEANALPDTELTEKRRLWQLAGEKFALALDIKSDFHHKAATNWGNVLNNEANALSELAEKRQLWQLAREKYAFALQIQPNKHDAANNWGITLNDEANALSELAEKRQLWQLAGEKFALALQIKPDYYVAAYNWGNALSDEAQALPDKELAEKHRLWKLAGEKYALALQIKPNGYEAATNWGDTLHNEANALPDTEWEEKRNLWQSALNKVQTLQNLSEKHQQSSAIQNLVNQIEQQITDLEKHKPSS